MLNDLLNKSEDLIKWWKLEFGVTLIFFSFLGLILGIVTPEITQTLDTEKLLKNVPSLVALILALLVLIILVAVSIFKSFKVLGSFNKLLEATTQEKAKNILKKSKILLTSIICLTIFPLLMFAPQLSGALAFCIIICKILFYKNNKEIQGLLSDSERVVEVS